MSEKLKIAISGEGRTPSVNIIPDLTADIVGCGYLLTEDLISDTPSIKTLLTNEEFTKLEQQAISTYWEMNKPFSDPVYICPKCGGGMCRENNMVYTSNPPCYRYQCNKCGNSEFRHI